MNGKGDKRRPCQISQQEADLRYELAFCKDEKRKAELMQKLQEYDRLSKNVIYAKE